MSATPRTDSLRDYFKRNWIKGIYPAHEAAKLAAEHCDKAVLLCEQLETELAAARAEAFAECAKICRDLSAEFADEPFSSLPFSAKTAVECAEAIERAGGVK